MGALLAANLMEELGDNYFRRSLGERDAGEVLSSTSGITGYGRKRSGRGRFVCEDIISRAAFATCYSPFVLRAFTA